MIFKRYRYRLSFFSAWSLLLLILLYGCGNGRSHDMDEKVLIRAGGSTVTVRAFHEAFESSITSPSVLFQDPDALRDEKYRILNRLSEELLILERARELGLKISDEEAARVINDFKKDFPDDTFEKTLMENGISFLTWQKALKRRLLMEKVIRHDLSELSFRPPLAVNDNPDDDGENLSGNMVVIADNSQDASLTSEAVGIDNSEEASLPDKPASDANSGDAVLPDEAVSAGNSEDTSSQDNEKLSGISAYATAAEAEYPDWIKRLKQQYAIEIDWKLWEIIVQEQADGA